MTQSLFYAKAVNGWPLIMAHLINCMQATPKQLTMILGDTARIASLGNPAENPDEAELLSWKIHRPPLWAAKTALFLLIQMPQKPVPADDSEQAAWAYLWLRLRTYQSVHAAKMALPTHLKEPLSSAIEEAWHDMQQQRLI